MEAAPFLQFLFNRLTGEYVAYDGTSIAPTQWLVSSDAAGKVVVRNSNGDVLGIGRWHYNATADRQRSHQGSKLDDALWTRIDGILYTLLEQARPHGPFDPNALDPAMIAPGDLAPAYAPAPAPGYAPAQAYAPAPMQHRPATPYVPPPAPVPPKQKVDLDKPGVVPGAESKELKEKAQEKKKGPIRSALEWIGAIIFLALIAVGIYIWEQYSPSKELGNGAECNIDKDCASRHCWRGHCRAQYDHNLSNGSHCEEDRECSSGNCSSSKVCIRR